MTGDPRPPADTLGSAIMTVLLSILYGPSLIIGALALSFTYLSVRACAAPTRCFEVLAIGLAVSMPLIGFGIYGLVKEHRSGWGAFFRMRREAAAKAGAQPVCPRCRSPLSFDPHNARWFCPRERLFL